MNREKQRRCWEDERRCERNEEEEKEDVSAPDWKNRL